MNHKSITFRCSPRQHMRLCSARQATETSRSDLIIAALEAFLDYTDQEHIRKLDLFALVNDINSQGEGPPFCEQA